MIPAFLTAKPTKTRIRTFVSRHADPGLTLDLGCGQSPYANLFPQRVGMDVFAGRGVSVIGDLHALPFHPRRFANVLCTEVFEHLREPRAAIDEIGRVLIPGGLLILTTRFLYPIHEAPGDYWRFTKFGLRDLLKDWDTISIEEENTTLETLGVLLQRMAFQGDLHGGKLSHALLLVLAKAVSLLPSPFKREYGNTVTRYTEGASTFPSGYHVVARRKK